MLGIVRPAASVRPVGIFFVFRGEPSWGFRLHRGRRWCGSESNWFESLLARVVAGRVSLPARGAVYLALVSVGWVKQSAQSTDGSVRVWAHVGTVALFSADLADLERRSKWVAAEFTSVVVHKSW